MRGDGGRHAGAARANDHHVYVIAYRLRFRGLGRLFGFRLGSGKVRGIDPGLGQRRGHGGLDRIRGHRRTGDAVDLDALGFHDLRGQLLHRDGADALRLVVLRDLHRVDAVLVGHDLDLHRIAEHARRLCAQSLGLARGSLLGSGLLSRSGLDDGQRGDMRVGSLVPVQETLEVDDIADVQGLDGLIDLGVLAAEIELHAEFIGRVADGDLEIQVVGLVVGVLVGESRAGLVIGLDLRALEGDELVHVADHVHRAPDLGDVRRLGYVGVGVGDDLKVRIGDLDLAGPLGLIALHADLGAGHELLVLLLGAVGVIQEVRAVLILSIERSLVVPPALLGLDIGLDRDIRVRLGGRVVGVAHHRGGRGSGLDDGQRGDMRVGSLVPVQETLEVDDIADVQGLDGLIDLGVLAAEIELHAELIGRAVLGDLEIQVVGLIVRVLVGKSGAGLIVGFDGHALEGDELVLAGGELVGAEQRGHVLGLGQEGLGLQDLKARVRDLDLAGPLGLIAGHTDLGAGNERIELLLGAGHVVQEVRAVLRLSIEGGLVFPPGLLGLDIGLYRDQAVELGGREVRIAHHGRLGYGFLGRFGSRLLGRRGGGGRFRCGGSGRLTAGGQAEHHNQRENKG